MSNKAPRTRKECSTCTYWGGTRKIISGNTWVETESYSTKGKCLIPKGGWKNYDKCANSSGCKDYKKWDALK